jgi:FK506-binding protein 4/5
MEEAPPAAGDDSSDGYVEEGDITPARDGGVVKEILVRGAGWQRAEAGDEVTIMYKGSLPDGTVFDSSYERGSPFSFKLGASSVIAGYELVAKTMSKGEKARVTIAPAYAYGAAGSPPKIPPNATLVFEMELVDFLSKKDVFGDGSVTKTELRNGAGWERPGSLSRVTLSVVGTAVGDADGRRDQVYSARRVCTVGAAEMPQAWEKVVPDMKKDSQLLLVCKPPRMLGAGLDGAVTLPPGTRRVEYVLTLESWVKVEILAPDDSSIVKQVLTDGDGWERPNEGASVVVDVSYAAAPAAAAVVTPKANPDPAVIAAATGGSAAGAAPEFHRETATAFHLGDGTVVDGLDAAIQSMKSGERACITIAAPLAYGSAAALLPAGAAAAGVGAGDPIAATVTLVRFEKAKDMWSMSFEEKVDEMMARKLLGNELFKGGRLALAVKAYERGIALFDSPTNELTADVRKRVNVLLVQCHLNLAACSERRSDVAKVIHHCNKALEVEPSNVKALYRRGSAFMQQDDYYNAESDLRYAAEVSAGNADVERRLARLAVLKGRQDRRERALYSNLFGRLSRMEEADRRAGVRIGDEDEPPADDDAHFDEDDDGDEGGDGSGDDGEAMEDGDDGSREAAPDGAPMATEPVGTAAAAGV